MARIEEQIRATRPDRSVLLSASAGSGKTRALVHRIIHLLASGAPPDSIVASTFSEKAAAQMEDRLYGELAGAAGNGQDVPDLIGLMPEDTPYPIVKSPEEILSELSAHPDALRISTIHSMCLWILRRFPLEAGLPPDFSVMEEWDITRRRGLAIDACLEEVAQGALAGEFDTLVNCGYGYDAVRALIEAAFGKRPHLMKLALDAGGPDGLTARVEAALDPVGKLDAADEALAGRVPQGLASRLNTLLPADSPKLAGYRAALNVFSKTEDIEGFSRAFEGLYSCFFTKEGDLKKQGPLTITLAQEAACAADPSLRGKARDEAARALKAEHDRLYEALRDDVTRIAGLIDYAAGARALVSLLRLFFRAEGIYSKSNRAEGMADYDDLEICAYGLLKRPEHTGLLSSVESRAAHYLVDEFQDTGELQWGIIERLASEAFSGMGVEGPGSPTMFVVGDKKQSIYRFRMASHRLMDTLRDKMKQNVATGKRDFPSLEHNFRSAPEIIRVVNETFSALLPGEYVPAVPFRNNARGSVTLNIVPAGNEAVALADAMEASLGIPVLDAETGEYRPAGYGDMAVLLRTRTRLGYYEDVFRKRGIPFKVVGGTGFFRQPEVRALVGILNYLDDPADTLSLAAALKSPLFGLSDGELEPFFRSTEPVEALAGISPEAHRLVTRWRGIAGVLPPGRIMQEIITGSAAAFVFGVKLGPSALMNMEKLAALAAGFDMRGGAGLSEFTGWLREYRHSSNMPGADVELPQFSQFASMMTVHAAKGLEFPIVFIANAGYTPRNHRDKFLLGTSEAGDMAVSTDCLLGDNPIYGRLATLEGEARVDESVRLLYVAMTRAMDRLVMSAGVKPDRKGNFGPPSGKSWAGLILKAAPENLIPQGDNGLQVPASHSFPATGPEKTAGRGKDKPRVTGKRPLKPDGARISSVEASSVRRFVSPSSLAATITDERANELPYPASLRGLAIHRTIEMYGNTGGYDARAACASERGFAALDRKAAEELVADVERTISRFLEDEHARGLITPGPGKYFELPLLLGSGGDVVYGSADLLVIESGEAAVYDFKTGLTGVDRDALAESYSPQLAAYCSAVVETFGVARALPFIVMVDTVEFIGI